jgi:hypothetical protein
MVRFKATRLIWGEWANVQTGPGLIQLAQYVSAQVSIFIPFSRYSKDMYQPYLMCIQIGYVSNMQNTPSWVYPCCIVMDERVVMVAAACGVEPVNG